MSTQREIGLFFGSFNPIHTGHLIIAAHVLNETPVSEVRFVVSPQNPFKSKGSLLNEQHRLRLVKLAIEDESRMRASNIEFDLPKPSYTVDTLIHLKKQHPDDCFSIIMGSDSLNNILNWKQGEYIYNNYNIYVFIRPGHPVAPGLPANIKILTSPLLEISASFIRDCIKRKKSIRWLVPDAVAAEIDKEQYYSSRLENQAE